MTLVAFAMCPGNQLTCTLAAYCSSQREFGLTWKLELEDADRVANGRRRRKERPTNAPGSIVKCPFDNEA